MSDSNHVLIKRWKKETRKTLEHLYPEVDRSQINEFLNNIINRDLKNPKCRIDNNYIGKTLNTTLLDVYDWIEKTNPICGGHGVFYKNQHEVMNPLAMMIQKFLTSRKAFKKMLKKLREGSYEYKTYDRKQLSEKISANSIYGTFGNIISFLFNRYTAPSVTGTGQSLISTTEQAFEAFLTNSVKFNNMNECITFLNNIISETYTMDSNFLKNVTELQLVTRLGNMFYDLRDEYIELLTNYVSNLSQDQINRIYYKNNLYEFSNHIEIRSILTTIIRQTSEFKDPNNVPEKSRPYLELLWKYYNDFVLYNYSPINRIQRLKNEKRETVLTIDTDSNFLYLNPWVEFMFKEIIEPDYTCDDRDHETLRFICINTMAFIITNMVSTVLAKYTKTANIPEDYRHFINIKNEFLMSRVVLASKKKRYISSIRLREGSEIYPEKVDIKGHDFIKSTATEETKARFIGILKKRILQPKNIEVSAILNDLRQIESDINKSLHNGEKTFITPKSVKELGAYKDPLKEQGVRAVVAWNYLYPEMEIELPAKIDLLKLTLDDDRQLEKLKFSNPEIYSKIDKYILNNDDKRIANKALPSIAIPKNVDRIPDWMIPFIDYDTISYNTLSKFYPLLESMGLDTIKTSKKEYFSNILNI